jgi:sec-independent protein translocase protein TatB
MFDFGLGSSELLLVAIIALIVIGPKDLPRLLRTMGQYMRKIQGMAREFQNHLNEAAKETGVDDMKKEVKGMTNFTVTADLDKQGAEIKKAIESSAAKASPANGAGGAKSDGAKTDGAKTDGAKTDGAGARSRRRSRPASRSRPPAPSRPSPSRPSRSLQQAQSRAQEESCSQPRGQVQAQARSKARAQG